MGIRSMQDVYYFLILYRQADGTPSIYEAFLSHRFLASMVSLTIVNEPHYINKKNGQCYFRNLNGLGKATH